LGSQYCNKCILLKLRGERKMINNILEQYNRMRDDQINTQYRNEKLIIGLSVAIVMFSITIIGHLYNGFFSRYQQVNATASGLEVSVDNQQENGLLGKLNYNGRQYEICERGGNITLTQPGYCNK
jgi:hypothetical protein